MRHDAAGFRIHCGNDIDAGGAADIADRPARAAGDIGAKIRVPAQLQRGEFSVRIQGQFRGDAHFACLLVGEQTFGAV